MRGHKSKVIYSIEDELLTIISKLEPGAGSASTTMRIRADLRAEGSLVDDEGECPRQFRHPRQGQPPRAEGAQRCTMLCSSSSRRLCSRRRYRFTHDGCCIAYALPRACLSICALSRDRPCGHCPRRSSAL